VTRRDLRESPHINVREARAGSTPTARTTSLLDQTCWSSIPTNHMASPPRPFTVKDERRRSRGDGRRPPSCDRQMRCGVILAMAEQGSCLTKSRAEGALLNRREKCICRRSTDLISDYSFCLRLLHLGYPQIVEHNPHDEQPEPNTGNTIAASDKRRPHRETLEYSEVKCQRGLTTEI
jgi:hypothetical protein